MFYHTAALSANYNAFHCTSLSQDDGLKGLPPSLVFCGPSLVLSPTNPSGLMLIGLGPLVKKTLTGLPL